MASFWQKFGGTFLGPFVRWMRNPRHRPLVLIFVVVTTVTCILVLETIATFKWFEVIRTWIASRQFFGPLLFPSIPPDWKDRLAALIPIIGLPIAFLLWHWRDRNVQDQIENERKDINLKEFQEVQLRAAGALDEKLPYEAREQLQIAALHQLIAFIRGDLGENFRKPAVELLFAGHKLTALRIGTDKFMDSVSRHFYERDEQKKPDFYDLSQKCRNKLNAVDRARVDIFQSEWDNIRSSGAQMQRRCFDFLELRGCNLSGLDLRESTFIYTNLHLSDISNSKLRYVRAEFAYLWETNLCGTDLSAINWSGANLQGAIFDDKTIFEDDVGRVPSAEFKKHIQDEFRKNGSRHVNDPPLDGPNFILGKRNSVESM